MCLKLHKPDKTVIRIYFTYLHQPSRWNNETVSNVTDAVYSLHSVFSDLFTCSFRNSNDMQKFVFEVRGKRKTKNKIVRNERSDGR